MNGPTEGLATTGQLCSLFQTWLCAPSPVDGRPWWRHGGGSIRSLSWGPTAWEGFKDLEGGHERVEGGTPRGSGPRGWSSSARAGGIAREREAEMAHRPGCGGTGGSGPGCRPRLAGLWVVHRALPQGRILLGPDGVPLRRVDVLAANGVIHMLEGILLPPTILPILPKHCSEEKHEMVAVSTRHMVPAFRGAQRAACCPPVGGQAASERPWG